MNPIEDFYAWVPSNSPSPSGPPNKAHDFTINLQYFEQLEGAWEVSLTEIHYPLMSISIDEETEFYWRYQIRDELPLQCTYGEIKIAPSIYRSVDHMIASLNEEFASKMKSESCPDRRIIFKLDSRTFQVTISSQNGLYTELILAKGSKLLKSLGFEMKYLHLPKTAPNPIHHGLLYPELYILCNFIDVQIVGWQKAALLRALPYHQSSTQYQHHEFKRRTYVRLSTGYINRLHFEVRNSSLELLNFPTGKLTLTLHFRRAKHRMALTQSFATESFMVTLPSNSPSPTGVPNKPQSFTVAIPHTDQLQGKWEVAMTEIHYPNNWFNLTSDSELTLVKFDASRTETQESFRIPAGYYGSIEDLVEMVNSKVRHLIILKYDKITRKVKIELQKFSPPDEAGRVKIVGVSAIQVLVNQSCEDLLSILGFRTQGVTRLNVPYESNHEANLKLHFPALFVYADFIDVQLVGNVKAPLLRHVPIEGIQGQYVHKEFMHRYYLNLSTGYINTVRIEICDDIQRPVQFQSGKVTVTLHFRPKRI